MVDKRIDGGKAFDWGRTSEDYARYRDIYPNEFYERIVKRGVGVSGQSVLDIGTGTGVLPRNMLKYGAKWTGIDIAENQIEYAKRLSLVTDIEYFCASVEDMEFPDNTFDVITACQCYWYFDHERIMPKLYRMLKPHGRILMLYMAWLPFEDNIARASEELALKYNPSWSGAGETIHPINVPKSYFGSFRAVYSEEYPLLVPFTRESWNGRMRSCRGVGASLSPEEIACWEAEHLKLLEDIAPEKFNIKHYAAIAELEKI